LRHLPGNDLLRNNLVYTVQEWAWDAQTRGGDEEALKVLVEQRKRFPKLGELREVARGHVHRVAKKLWQEGRFEAARAAVERYREVLPDEDARSISVAVYDEWADRYMKDKEWQAAVDVYDAGLKRFPKDGHLTHNATVTWDHWAKTFMAKKDWAGAIAI